MPIRIVAVSMPVVAVLVVVLPMHARGHDTTPRVVAGDLGRAPTAPLASGVAIGPDIICSRTANSDTGGAQENTSMIHWGDAAGIAAYSTGTTSCNIGDQVHPWVAGASAQHPVIAQNFFRLADGRFEQIGMSWLKHGFCAVSEPTCGQCVSTGCGSLGVGCADTYNASLNGSQFDMGPRSNVNPTTGVHSHPYDSPIGDSVTRGRLQCRIVDVDPALNAGARYFTEGHYIGEQDAAAGNHMNNVSNREFEFLLGDWGIVVAAGATQPQMPAITAWPGATIESVTVDGRFMLGHLVTDNGDGTWHYEYALYNMNSHRSAASFSVPVPECVTVTNIGFHDVDYHSGDGEGAVGENYDGTDWPGLRGFGDVTWSTEAFAFNANANALRWGTLYNFRFDADAPPAVVTATMGLFRPGSPISTGIPAAGPAMPAAACVADCHWIRVPGACPDDVVDVADLLAVLADWGLTTGCEIDGSGTVDVGDLLAVLGAWGPCGG